MIWQFASRYFVAKKSTHAINIISWVSISAITVGTAALIIVLSVFNGFEDLVKSLYSSFYPEIKASPAAGKTMLVPADKLAALQRLGDIKSISETIEEKAVLRYNNEQTIAELKGVDKNYPVVTGISRKIIRGNYDTGTDDSPMAVVGIGIEAALGIDVQRNFIPVTVYIPKRDAQSFVLPEEALNTGQIRPAGTFAIQQDFDNKYVITNIQFMRQMLNMQPGEVSGLEIALKDPGRMEAAKQEIQQILGSGSIVQTRYEQNRSLYNIMQTEKWAVYAILAFILIIAAFNMIGSLYMLVIEKRKDITILKAMGARDSLLRKIFLSEGLLIAAGGALIGALIAVALCLLQQKFGLIKLGGGSFVVDAYPVSMHWPDFVLVFSTILIIGLLASWYPAAKAARQPVELKAQ